MSSVQYEVPESFLTRDQSALDTLAEVSRRHLDYSAHQHHFDPVQHPTHFIPDQDLNEQDLLVQLRAACAEDSIRRSPAEHTEQHVGNAHTNLSNDSPSMDQTTAGAAQTSPLVEAASAANNHLEQAHQSPTAVDPLLEEQPELEPEPPLLQHSPEDNNGVSWNPENMRAFANGLSIMTPFNEANPTSGMVQRPAKSKVRNKFTDTRRQEVKENRKRGACLRCRMLKKPCSEGNPCTTCKSVESARLWKGSCIRTRVADEFTLWSTGLFHARAVVDISSAVYGMLRKQLLGTVEVQLFGSSDLNMAFAARECAPGPGKAAQLSQGDDAEAAAELVILEQSPPFKVEEYMNQSFQDSVAYESNPFLKATLQQAHNIILEQSDSAPDPPDAQASRSSYSIQDQLLRNVVELWAETSVLARLHHDDVKLKYHPTRQPNAQPTSTTTAHADNAASPLSNRSRTLILAQVLSAVETRGSALSKTVLNELERRLLQRKQVSRFVTFVSSILLLNCIERMTGLYRSFDPDQTSNPDSNSAQLRPSHWPLDEPPRKLWLQGERFADLLIMLLRMRALPPRTCKTADGTLIVDQSQATAREQAEEPTTVPAAWLDPIQLKEDEVVAIRDRGLPDPAKGADGWDLKFISRLLVPEQNQ